MKKEITNLILEAQNISPSGQYMVEKGNFLRPIRVFEAVINVSPDSRQQLISSLNKGEKPEIQFYNCSGSLVKTGVIQAEEILDDMSKLKIYIPLTSDQELSLYPPRFEAFEGN